MFVLCLVPEVSALQLKQSGILSFWPFECVPALILSAITLRPSRPYN